MKQIYPDILDLVHEGKNVSGLVCVFSDEHSHSFLLHFFFFLILTLKNNKTPLTPQFKTWDLNLHRQLFSKRNVKYLTEFPERTKSHDPLIKTTLKPKAGHTLQALEEGCLFHQSKTQCKLDVDGITTASLWCSNFLRTYWQLPLKAVSTLNYFPQGWPAFLQPSDW